MKKFNCLLALLLVGVMLLSSCTGLGIFNNGEANSGDSNGGIINNGGSSNGGSSNGGGNVSKPQALPLPDNFLSNTERQAVIGSIVQTGDGNAYVNGTVPSPQSRMARSASFLQTQAQASTDGNKHLVTLEHAYGHTCYVSGYIGNSLYIIQDFGSLAWNKKGIGHMDGTVLLEYGENGYFSISSFSENKIIVGNPTDEAVESLWDATDSYMFGYMVYDPDTRELVPMYEENNIRFYTAGYFIGGVALVSVKENGKILFGIIDSQGNYVVEPKYEMMSDESINNVVIVGLEAEAVSSESFSSDTCGRNIYYDSTLMTNVQSARHYECRSQSVGLINTLTGESVLPCSYAYIERVMDDTYFVIDNEGASFLYDANADALTPVETGIYSYFDLDWMVYTDRKGVIYLADKELQLYETTELDLSRFAYSRNAEDRINTNIISALRNETAKRLREGTYIISGIDSEYDPETRTYNITVTDTGDVFEGVRSFTYPYNGGILYTVENSLYRYDMESRTSTRIETGYGNYTEDYDNWGATYHAELVRFDEGIFVLRYNIEYDHGSSYLMIIVNDKGEVLFDAAINSLEKLQKNYLGKYDDALYSLVGSTEIEDNYYLTRNDGSHYLIQFVRGEADNSDSEGENEYDYSRTVDSLWTVSLLSPFMLDFADGSEISVTIGDVAIPADCYVYDSDTQSFKLLTKAFDCDMTMLETMRADGFLEIIVISGEETIALRIEVSPFALEL